MHLPSIIVQYIDIGWKLIPIASHKKIPVGNNGLTHATSDMDTIKQWYRKWPNCNWAVACALSGLTVIDIDPRHGGDIEFSQLTDRLGKLVDVPRQRSGGGGEHYFLKDPGVKLRSKYGNGIDVKHNGYILVEPSVTESPYKWIISPCDGLSSNWPSHWLDEFKDMPTSNERMGSTQYGKKALEEECSWLISQPKGSRNNALNLASLKIGELVGGGEIQELEARKSLSYAAIACGLEESEVNATITSGMNAGKRKPRNGKTFTPTLTKGEVGQIWDLGTLTQPESKDSILLACETIGLQPPDDSEWLINGLLPKGVCCVIGGVPKANKSFLANDLIVAGAMGQSILGTFKPREPFTSLIYSPEGGLKSIRRRLWRLCRGRGGNPVIALQDIHIITDRVCLSNPISYKQLRATVNYYKPDLLLIDPLISSHVEDENSADQIQPILDRIRDLQKDCQGLTTIVVHHCGKAEGRSAGYSLRGSSAIEAWRDTLISIRITGKSEDDSSSIRRVVVSHRDEPAPHPTGFRLVSSTIPGTNCELDYEIQPCGSDELKPGRRLDPEKLELLRKCLVANSGGMHSASDFGISRWKAAADCGMEYKMFTRYLEELQRLNEISITEDGKIKKTDHH